MFSGLHLNRVARKQKKKKNTVVNLVDLVKRFPLTISLQKSPAIQLEDNSVIPDSINSSLRFVSLPRTGLAKCIKIAKSLDTKIRNNIGLQRLELIFWECRELKDVAELGRAVGRLQKLQRLVLDFSYCTALSDIAELGSGVGQLHSPKMFLTLS